jgi:membrane protein YdbS with pleckstrin-like domain
MEKSKSKLHPGVKWSFRFGGYLSGIFFVIFMSVFFLGVIGALVGSILVGFVLLILFAILWIIMVEVFTQMAYNRWFYEFDNNGMKIEKGIIWKKYSNIPYERIQNVDIRRGVIARMLGFSSIEIQTAGYGGFYGGRGGHRGHSEGYLPGVEIKKAEQIRDFLMKKISGKKSGV